MDISEPKIDGYERIVRFVDNDFSAYIALHNTRRGPALGGCRVKRYGSDDEALKDALDLSRAMSYKNALAELSFGGGKCVVNAPVATRDIMHKVGEAVDFLHGEYVTAEDIGTTIADMGLIHDVTPYVVHKDDGSPWTALGVYACIIRLFDAFSMWDLSYPRAGVWVEGLGKVGWALAERLHQHGKIRIFVSDIVSEKVRAAIEKFGAIAHPDTNERLANLYAPCAMGHVLNEHNASLLPSMICGSANNQLDAEDKSDWLDRHRTIYCPDFLVNAGGVIAAAAEINGDDHETVEHEVRAIADRLMEIFYIAERENRDPVRTAIMQAEMRIRGA